MPEAAIQISWFLPGHYARGSNTNQLISYLVIRPETAIQISWFLTWSSGQRQPYKSADSSLYCLISAAVTECKLGLKLEPLCAITCWNSPAIWRFSGFSGYEYYSRATVLDLLCVCVGLSQVTIIASSKQPTTTLEASTGTRDMCGFTLGVIFLGRVLVPSLKSYKYFYDL